MNIQFKTCPDCNGYGVRDNGRNCKTCGGVGAGGLLGNGTIGSGEIMIDTDTGRRVTSRQLVKIAKAKKKAEQKERSEP